MKKVNLFLILLMACGITLGLYAQSRIVLSAALTDSYFEARKQQYVDAFNILKQFGYGNPYIVEAVKKQGPTFLNEYSNNVFYSTENDPKFKNYGINEAATVYEGICHFDFDPEDMVVKMTGRYHLISDHFLKMVEAHLDCDAIVKFNEPTSVDCAGFAMKCKFFKQMCENMDHDQMERDWVILETEVANYINKKVKEGNFKVCYLDRLDIRADLYASTWYTYIGKDEHEERLH